MIYVFGADPFDRSPSSQALAKALKEAGFKLSEIQHAKTTKDIPDNSWVICFGFVPLRALTSLNEPLTELRGQLVSMDSRDDVLVLPTYAPGYLYRNPELMWQWKEDLVLFKAVISYG